MKSRLFTQMFVLSLGLLFTGVVFAGDTLSKPKVLSDESISLTQRLSTNYDKIIIKEFTAEKPEYSYVNDQEKSVILKMTPNLLRTITDTCEAELKDKKLFKQIVKGGKPSGKAVILEGDIVEFNAGSKALKWFVGYGAGKVYLKIKGRLVDAETGKELASFEERETGYLGSMTTMSFDDVYPIQAKNIGENLAKFIEKLY
jgi:uncharacterized protein DUF4410